MKLRDDIERYLTGKLYPFWFDRVAAPAAASPRTSTATGSRPARPTGR